MTQEARLDDTGTGGMVYLVPDPKEETLGKKLCSHAQLSTLGVDGERPLFSLKNVRVVS